MFTGRGILNGVPYQDGKRALRALSHYVEVTLDTGAASELLTTNWVEFYIVPNVRASLTALFGPDDGARVPAFLITYIGTIVKGDHPITNPFEGEWHVSAVYGSGRPGAVAGDAFGVGRFIVDEVVDDALGQAITADIDFKWENVEGVACRLYGTVKALIE